MEGPFLSIIPIASAAQLLPAAVAAGRVATEAMGSFADFLREAADSSSPTKAQATRDAGSSASGGLTGGIDSLLRDFASAFNRLLQNHDLDAGDGVELRLGETGNVEVAGVHPQSSAIESLLAKTPQLSEMFRRLAAQITADRKEEEFQNFQANSHSPADKFPLLFSHESAPKFHLRIQGESAQAAFV